MKRASGGTLPEYGLILALIVLAAVGAIGFLGTSISDGLTNAGDLSRADDLFAVMDANTNDPYAGGANIAVATTNIPGPSDSGSTSPQDAGSVPDFGAGTETVSIGNITTSAEGTEMAVDVIDALASGEAVDGSALFGNDWPGIQDLLTQLSNKGTELAVNEKNSLGYDDGDLEYNTSALKEVQDGTDRFANVHNDLMKKINDASPSDSAEFETFMKLLDTSSGIISYGAKEFVYAGAKEEEDFKLDTGKLTTVGTQYQAGDVVEIPVVTQTASDQIQQAAN